MSRSLHGLLKAVVLAGKVQRDPIPDSDLDDEQPISLNIRLTLGQLRQARAACSALTGATEVGYIKVARDPDASTAMEADSK